MIDKPLVPRLVDRLLSASFVARHLDPTDRLMEVQFGLIMTLTFTLGAGLFVQGSEGVTAALLLSVLGCNVAWGLIDGAMYMTSCVLERSRKATLIRDIRVAVDTGHALELIGAQLDQLLQPLTTPEERNRLYTKILERLRRLEPHQTRLQRDDFLGALACFLLVAICAVPALVPIIVIDDRFTALRASNALQVCALFMAGFSWGRATNCNAMAVGLGSALIGLLLVGIAVALGG